MEPTIFGLEIIECLNSIIDIGYNKRQDHRQLCFEAVFATGRQAAGINLFQASHCGNQDNGD